MKLNIVTSGKVGKWDCMEVSSYSWGGCRGLLPVPKGICDNTWGGGDWGKDGNCGIVNLTTAFHLSREMASVATICSTSLLIFPRMIPGWEPKKGDKGDTLIKVWWMLLWSPQAAIGASVATCGLLPGREEDVTGLPQMWLISCKEVFLTELLSSISSMLSDKKL